MPSLFDQLLAAAKDGTLTVPVRAPRVVGEAAQLRDAIVGYAHQTLAERRAMEEPIYGALRQYGGRITADYIQYAPGKWRMAGEFADIPKRLLRRPDHLDPNKTRVNGNLDQVADAAGVDEQDLKDFLAQNPRRATFAQAMRDAHHSYKRRRR